MQHLQGVSLQNVAIAIPKCTCCVVLLIVQILIGLLLNSGLLIAELEVLLGRGEGVVTLSAVHVELAVLVTLLRCIKVWLILGWLGGRLTELLQVLLFPLALAPLPWGLQGLADIVFVLWLKRLSPWLIVRLTEERISNLTLHCFRNQRSTTDWLLLLLRWICNFAFSFVITLVFEIFSFAWGGDLRGLEFRHPPYPCSRSFSTFILFHNNSHSK
jgi:hypothetical protein